MQGDQGILVATAFSIGVFHTLLGPDHYVPFVALSKCNRWSTRKTLAITVLCGLGHVAGSVALGCMGLLLGTALFHLEELEAFRGDGAAWLLIAFGITYFTWGISRAVRNAPQAHVLTPADDASINDAVSSHLRHQHDSDHPPLRDRATVVASNDPNRGQSTPWVLFLIFVFGPCEVLIPLLMYPAANSNWTTMMLVVAAFAVATIGSMVTAVMALTLSLNAARLPDLHRYNHALAGFAILICGTLVKLGL